jgi:hypothetical protein
MSTLSTTEYHRRTVLISSKPSEQHTHHAAALQITAEWQRPSCTLEYLRPHRVPSCILEYHVAPLSTCGPTEYHLAPLSTCGPTEYHLAPLSTCGALQPSESSLERVLQYVFRLSRTAQLCPRAIAWRVCLLAHTSACRHGARERAHAAARAVGDWRSSTARRNEPS